MMRDAAVAEVGGEPITLRFTWSAIDRIREAWGPEFDARVGEAISGPVPADLAFLIEAAGGPKASETMETSPPLGVCCALVMTAWNRAWTGGQPVEAKGDENPPNAPVTWWARLWGRILRQGADTRPSGG